MSFCPVNTKVIEVDSTQHKCPPWFLGVLAILAHPEGRGILAPPGGN